MANTLEIIVRAQDKASGTLGKVNESVQHMSTQLKVAGAAMTAVGIAGLKMASDARKMNADLGYMGTIIDATTAEMRELALAVTDVTFGLKSVTATFELLARAGVKDQETMKQNALAFDALADATKSSAETVADILIPAYKMFGEEIPTTAAEMDKWTYLVTTTNVELSELGSLMGYVATYGRDLNLTGEQLVLMMKTMAEQGRSASDAARLLRTGINQAGGSFDKLMEILGITTEELNKYSDEMEESAGITRKLQEQQESQYTVLDKLKQRWQELTLSLAPVLEFLEPIFSVMTAMGPAVLAAVYVLPKLSVAFSALRAKMAAVTIQAAAMWAAITLGVSLAITGIIELVRHWDDVVAFFKGPAYRATKNLETAMKDLADTMMEDIKQGATEATESINNLITLLQTGGYKELEFLSEEQLDLIRQVNPELAQQIEYAQNMAKASGRIADSIEDQIEAQKDANRLLEINQELLTAEGPEREALLQERAEIEERWWKRDWKRIVEQNQPILDEALKDLMKPWDRYHELIAEGWDGSLEDLENRVIPAWNELVESGFKLPATGQEQLDAFYDALEELEKQQEKYRHIWSHRITPEMPLMTDEDLKKLFGLQYGGIVTKPTAAIIGEKGPEAVIPLPQMPMGELTISVGYLMGDEISLRRFAREIQRILGQETRRTEFGQVNTGYFFGRSSI